MRLRRSDCSGPGLRRVKRGRGFSYLDERGDRVTDPETLERIRELTIPPAWEDVWICRDANGHLQATGTDAARRKQYIYHPMWRIRRDREKFERALVFARRLPRLREVVGVDLDQEDVGRERVLACAARLLDRGLFRIGSEEYAESDGGIGLATIRKEQAGATIAPALRRMRELDLAQERTRARVEKAVLRLLSEPRSRANGARA